MVLGVPIFEHIIIRLLCAKILGHLKIINFTFRKNENFIIFGCLFSAYLEQSDWSRACRKRHLYFNKSAELKSRNYYRLFSVRHFLTGQERAEKTCLYFDISPELDTRKYL